MFLSLNKASQFHPRFFHQVNTRGKHAWRISVQSFELVTPSPPIAPAEKGRAIAFIWIAHIYLYEQVTELLLGGDVASLSTGYTDLQRACRSWWAAETMVGISAACTTYLQACFERVSFFELEFAS